MLLRTYLTGVMDDLLEGVALKELLVDKDVVDVSVEPEQDIRDVLFDRSWFRMV